MADWRLKPRSGRCTRCGAPFTPGGSGFSLLTPDPAGEGYVRHDLCADCHAALPPEARRGASATWPFTVPAAPPKADAASPRAPHPNADAVLRAALGRGDPRDRAAIYVLALLLERGKRLVERQLTRDEAGRTVHLYEERASGDLLPIVEPPLTEAALPEMRQRVAEWLEHGVRPPVRVLRRPTHARRTRTRVRRFRRFAP